MINLTKSNFDSEVLKYGGKVLVDFYAPWCAECNALSPVLDKVSQKTDDVKFCSFNCDEARDFVVELGIMSIPSLFLFENGKLIDKKTGILEENEIIKLIKAGV